MANREAASAQWRPEDDGDYGRRMLGHLLARHLWLILLGAFVAAVIFLVVSLGQQRVYSADASMQVDKSAGAAGAGAGGVGALLGTGPDLTGEIEVLRSRQLIEPVIDDLGLQVDVFDMQAPDSSVRSIKQRLHLLGPLQETREEQFTRLTVRDVTVDSELLKNQAFILEGTEGGGWKVEGRSGGPGERVVLGHVSFTPVFGPGHKPGYKYTIGVHPASEAYENFRKNLGTSITSDVVHVSFRYHNPVICARAVNELVTQYLERYGASKGTDYGVVLKFIADETAKHEKEVGRITDELDKYQKEQGTYLPTAQGGAAITAIGSLEQQQTQNQIQLMNLNNVLANWQNRSPQDIYKSIQAPATDLQIESSLVSGLAERIAQLQTAQMTKTERHPDVIALKEGINSQIRLIRDALVTSRNALQTANARLAGEIGQQKGLLKSLPEAESRIFLLTSELQVNRDILSKLKQNEIDTELRQASVEREARVLDLATVPVKKEAPRVGRNTVVGFATGAIVMALLALLFEAMNRRMKSLREVRLGTGLPVLGVVPGGRLGRWVPREKNPQLFKRIASYLEANRKVIGVVQLPMVDSSYELAWGLAGAIAEATGQPALLIDADRMDAALCAALNLDPRHSLTDVAAGEVDVNKALMQLDERRWMLQLGAGHLNADALAPVFDTLRETFSSVIVCLPPALQWNGQEALMLPHTPRSVLGAVVSNVGGVPTAPSSVIDETRVSRLASPIIDSVIVSMPQNSMLLEELRENVNELRVLGIEPDGAVVTNYSSRRDVLGREELRFAAVRPGGNV